MSDVTEMKRVNIRVSKRVDDWFAEKSARTGLARSALMYLALEEHINQQELSHSLPALLKKIDELEQTKK